MSVTAAQLVGVSAHIGHKRHKTHAKSRVNLHKYDSNIAIIDSFKTAAQIETAVKILQNASKDGQTLLVVGTKKVAKEIVRNIAKSSGYFYITSKWIAGTLTNFQAIKKNLQKIADLNEYHASSAFKEIPKHEQMNSEKDLGKLNRTYDGIVSMKQAPDLLFVVDAQKEKNAILEAKKLGIKVIAICDTNADPSSVDYPIVANDDSLSSVEFILKETLGNYKFTPKSE